MKIKIEQATVDLASHIASLIMEAMGPDCCQNFAGNQYTLADFHNLMTRLVEMEDSQYSYRNTLCAMTSSGILVGVCVSYDGGQLHALRSRFINAAYRAFGQDYSSMAEETQAGEFYIDSLAVSSKYRGKGIATMLLKAAVERAQQQGHAVCGLLVDKANLGAEAFYTKFGFQYVDDNVWGGHPMKHLQYTIGA